MLKVKNASLPPTQSPPKPSPTKPLALPHVEIVQVIEIALSFEGASPKVPGN
jgi:hypothetical protein